MLENFESNYGLPAVQNIRYHGNILTEESFFTEKQHRR
jgi:hypothetical protein